MRLADRKKVRQQRRERRSGQGTPQLQPAPPSSTGGGTRLVTRETAWHQLHTKRLKLASLVSLGALKEREVGERKLVELDADATGPDVMEAFYDRLGPCTEAEHFEPLRKAALILCGKRRAPPPERLTEDAFAYMSAKGIAPTVLRLRSLTGTTEAIARRQLLDRMVKSGAGADAIRTHFHAPPGEHEAAVLERLPEHLREAPGTYRCPRSGHPDDKPTEGEFARISTITNQRLFVATALLIMWLATAEQAKQQRDALIRAAMAVDRGGGGFDLDDPYVMRERLETILGPDWASGHDAPSALLVNVNDYGKLAHRFDEYIAQAVPQADQAAYSSLAPVRPAGHVNFFGAIRTRMGGYRLSFAANRQSRIQKILDNPLEFLLVGRLRLKEHQSLRERCRAEIDAHIATGKKLTKPLLFSHTYTTRLVNDRFRQCEQTVYLALWTWSLVHEKMHAADRALGKPRHAYGENAKVSNEGRDGYVVAYLGVMPTTPGGPVQPPLIAEVANSFVLDKLASLSTEQLRRRDEACRPWGLATHHAVLPSGVGHFAWSRRHTAREANTLLVDTKANGETGPLLLIAHEEFTIGLQYAHASVFISADAGCRTGECLQTPADTKSFGVATDPDTKEVFKTFDAVGKGGMKTTPLVSPDTFAHVIDLIIDVANLWHGGKIAPPTVPNHHLVKRKIKEVRRYAFTVNERMINHSEISTLHQILYLGLHGLRGQDVRHLFNSMGRKAGISREVRQRLLNHANPGTTDKYGPLTAKEVSTQQMELQRHIAEKASSLLASSAGGSSEEMRTADREMRRAEVMQRFYAAEGCDDEAEEARLEKQRWAEALARATAAFTGGAHVVDPDSI